MFDWRHRALSSEPHLQALGGPIDSFVCKIFATSRAEGSRLFDIRLICEGPKSGGDIDYILLPFFRSGVELIIVQAFVQQIW